MPFFRRYPFVLFLILALAVVAGVYYFFGRDRAPEAGMAGMGMPVETYAVKQGAIEEILEAVGTLSSNQSAIIRPEITGKVVEIAFTEGQTVKKDDVLVKLDDSIIKAEVARSRANFELGKLTYNRQSTLQKKGVTSPQVRDEAQAQMKGSQAGLSLSQAQLDKTAIRAPYDGVVGLREVNVGDVVSAGQVITQVISLNPIMVDFSIPEKYVSAVQPGQSVMVTVDAYPGETFTGTVHAIAPQVDPDTRNVRIKAQIDNAEQKLRTGMFAYVKLAITRNAQALLVPEQALIPKQSEMFVFKVVDGKAANTRVKTGLRKEGMVEIVEGVAAGDVVVTSGHMKLQDGVPVAPMTPVEGSAQPAGAK